MSGTLRRSIWVLVASFFLIVVSRLLRGHALLAAAAESFAWASVSTLVFAVWDARRLRHGERCAICDERRVEEPLKR